MTDRLHVLLAQSGDREAFDALLKSIQEPLYRYLVRVMSDHAAAEDTLQDVFLVIFRKLRWLDDPELFRPWAYRIATRAAFKRLKSIDLPELLEHVSPASRAVLALHYVEDMTLPEVAAVLGIPVGTAKSRLAYGLTQLRGVFNA